MTRIEIVINELNKLSSKDLVACSDSQLKTLQALLDCRSVEASTILKKRIHYRTHFYQKSEKTNS